MGGRRCITQRAYRLFNELFHASRSFALVSISTESPETSAAELDLDSLGSITSL